MGPGILLRESHMGLECVCRVDSRTTNCQLFGVLESAACIFDRKRS